jgi:putative membrane protein
VMKSHPETPEIMPGSSSKQTDKEQIMYGMGYGGSMFGGGLVMLLLIALVVALVFYWVKPSGGRSTTQKSALDILDERYARGEIEKDEFEQKKRELSK